MCDGVDRGEQSEDLVCTERDMVINVVLDRDGRLLLDHFVDVGDFERRGRHVRGEDGGRDVGRSGGDYGGSGVEWVWEIAALSCAMRCLLFVVEVALGDIAVFTQYRVVDYECGRIAVLLRYVVSKR